MAPRFDPVRDGVDIILVALGIYWLLTQIRQTRAVPVLSGLMVLIAASLSSEWFGLRTLGLIFDKILAPEAIVIVVVFQDDIRRVLAKIGSFDLIGDSHTEAG